MALPLARDTSGNVVLKMIVIGDSGAGKSSLLHFLCDGTFDSDGHTQTIGVEFASKQLEIDGRAVKLQLWDTAGQERYRSVTRSYYRGAQCCVVVFDVTRRESFVHVQQWHDDALELASSSALQVLVGNKIDLVDRREVTFVEAAEFAQRHKMLHFECSAATGEMVAEAFAFAAKAALGQQSAAHERASEANDKPDEKADKQLLRAHDNKTCGCS
jgi:small GTP-binding protein